MEKLELRRELSLCLLDFTEPSVFVKKAYALILKSKPKTTFAELARKMGFSSRSFVRQLVVGDKKPNLQNYRKIAEGFGLSPEATGYFGLLIEQNQNGKSTHDLQKRINEVELKLRRSLQKNIKKVRKSDPVPFERWPFIYASLGTAKDGRTLQDIIKISGQDSRICAEILDYLAQKEIIVWNAKTHKYYPKEEVIDIGELGDSKILRNLFKLINLESVRRVDTHLNSESMLFHSAVFSVKSSQLPQLTKDLQTVLLNYVSAAEDSAGEDLAMLSSSLIPLR